LRRDGKVGSAAQAAVEIGPGPALDADLALSSLSEEKLAEVLGVPLVVRSTATRASEQSDLYGGLTLLVRPAEGVKCPRCWQMRKNVEPGPDGICARCRRVVGE
jgi:isoleucyl-tRNA synthetase